MSDEAFFDDVDTHEVADTFRVLSEMLRSPSMDGGIKRSRSEKPPWRVDTTHEAALFSHLARWKAGELKDPDSGAHPLTHLAWRALALAYQDTEREKA